MGGLGGWLLHDHQHRRESAVVALVALAGTVSSGANGQLTANLTLVNAGGQPVSVRLSVTAANGQISEVSYPVAITGDWRDAIDRSCRPRPTG